MPSPAEKARLANNADGAGRHQRNHVIIDVETGDPCWSAWSRRQLVQWLDRRPVVINATIYGEIGAHALVENLALRAGSAALALCWAGSSRATKLLPVPAQPAQISSSSTTSPGK